MSAHRFVLCRSRTAYAGGWRREEMEEHSEGATSSNAENSSGGSSECSSELRSLSERQTSVSWRCSTRTVATVIGLDRFDLDSESDSTRAEGADRLDHIKSLKSTNVVEGKLSKLSLVMEAASGRFTAGAADRNAVSKVSPGRRYAKLLSRSGYYETISGIVVMCDFIAICQDADATAKMDSDSSAKVIMNVCFGYYVFDLCLRFYADGLGTFKHRGTWLDLLIVFVSVLEHCLALVQVAANEGSFLLLRMIRLFRLLRLIRIGKLFAGMKELKMLVQMIGTCAKTMFWSFLMAFLVTTMWAVVAVELVHPVTHRLQETGQWEDCERCGRAFESVWAATLTFFQTVLAGDSWGVVAMPIIEDSPWTGVIFCGALFTLTYGIMQLITAVVVDSFSDMRKFDVNALASELEADERDEKQCLRSIFESIDADCSGVISLEELIDGTRKSKDFGQWLRVMDLDGNDVQRLFTMLDINRDGSVAEAEFIDVLYRMKNAESRTTVKMVKHVIETMEMAVDQLATNVESLHKRFEMMQMQLSTTSPPASPRTASSQARQEECATLPEVEVRLHQACSIALRAALSAASDKVCTLREEAILQRCSTGGLSGCAQDTTADPHRWFDHEGDRHPYRHVRFQPCAQNDTTPSSVRSCEEACKSVEPHSQKERLKHDGDLGHPGGPKSFGIYLQFPSGQPAGGQQEARKQEGWPGEAALHEESRPNGELQAGQKAWTEDCSI
eukprot:TRINITY_DN13262_c0_g1_i1.p1 TRINITY_DN13262_c0_g1~~TRINITY_DN13262_c0_g1_i1.p1  ORF type:complete len:740 (-),score=80.57 TRINITY_DN13262_c0_g1_i1:274-2463(-)